MKKIAIIGRPKGLDGDISLSLVPTNLKNLEHGTKVYIGYSENFIREYEIRKWKAKRGKGVANLLEVTNEEQADRLKEMGVFAENDILKSIEDTAFLDDELIGCEVYSNDGELMGIIKETWGMPANDIWVIELNASKKPFPVIDNNIIEYDLPHKRITVIKPDGFDELEM